MFGTPHFEPSCPNMIGVHAYQPFYSIATVCFQASDRMIRRFTPSPTIEDMKQIAAIDKTDLTQSVLGLQFWVTSEHFLSSNSGNRKLKVKCRQEKINSRTATEL